MKKYFVLLAFSALFTSCSDDDAQPIQQNQDFFNLVEGNYWKYKIYTVYPDGTSTFNGAMDSVVVAGQEILDGIPFYKLEHWRLSGDISQATFEYAEHQRVNDSGHLINDVGEVIHPGYDIGFQHTRQVVIGENLGDLNFAMGNITSFNVEGSTYTVYPYLGYFVPEIDVPESIGSYRYYTEGIGEVYQKYRFVSGNLYVEKRLISHHLN